MNGCNQVNIDLIEGALNNQCNFYTPTDTRYVTSKYYLNLSKISFVKTQSSDSQTVICYYDKDYNFVRRQVLHSYDMGENVLDLNPNYYVKFSGRSALLNELKGYQCNVGIGSMSNELAFGSVNFNDTISTIIPFIIILIGFGLGFSLLKRIINKGSKGSAL